MWGEQGFPKRVAGHFHQWCNAWLDLFLPRQCAGCGQTWLLPDQGCWCEACLEDLSWIRSPLCTRCGCPFPDSGWHGDLVCGECSVAIEHPLDSARSATEYVGIIRERIHQLKFGAQLHWAPSLAQLLVTALESQWAGTVDLLVPVPLHRKRLRQRGFNQAALLARTLGKTQNLPVSFDALSRRVWTEPQTRLKRQERLENVKDAFHVAKPSAVDGLAVLLIDDVFTTGSTLKECARALKNAGVARVHALTVARVPEAAHDK